MVAGTGLRLSYAFSLGLKLELTIMSFRLFTYPKRRKDAKPAPPGKELSGRRKKARRRMAALSGFQDTDLRQDPDMQVALGNVTPSRQGQD